MDLWVRSQYKRKLIKVDNIEIVERNDMFLLLTDMKVFINGDVQYITLGEYETKERALEVLNEIQFCITVCNGYDCTIGECNELTGYFSHGVYRMPKK